MDQAAALIITYGTILYAFRDRAFLSKGETLLVSGTSGGIGSAAVELGLLFGTRVIACVQGDDKVAELQSQGVTQFVDPDPETIKGAIRTLM